MAPQREQSYLQMRKSRFRKVLIRRQSLIDNGIGTFGKQLDPLVGTSNDDRHPLSGRVEFTDI